MKTNSKKISVQDFLDMAYLLSGYCEIYELCADGTFGTLKGMARPGFDRCSAIPFSAFGDWDNRMIVMKNKDGEIFGAMGPKSWFIEQGESDMALAWHCVNGNV